MSRFAKQIFLAGLLFLPLGGVASAQATASSSCQDFQTLMKERQGLLDQLAVVTGHGKKKQIDPHQACNVFTKLSNHGVKVLKWLDENKDWCQIPDEFVDNAKKEQGSINATRGQACKVAAQMDAARRNPQGGGTPPGWGGGVNGQYQIPKGAL